MSDAASVMVEAVWRGRPLANASDHDVQQARILARRNLVEDWVIRAYSDRLPVAAAEARGRFERWRSNLDELATVLGAAGVSAVLIKSGLEGRDQADDRPPAAVEYGDIDLVIGVAGWDRALAAVREWGKIEAAAPIEPHKVMVRPGRGPAAHLHRDAEWFGIPVIPLRSLRAEAQPLTNGVLVPSVPVAMVVLIAHAVFQTLELTLSDLVELRRLLAAGGMDQRLATDASGWEQAARRTLHQALAAIEALDRGLLCRLPISLAGARSIEDGWRHARHLSRTGRPGVAVREALLRPCLVAAKYRSRLT